MWSWNAIGQTRLDVADEVVHFWYSQTFICVCLRMEQAFVLACRSSQVSDGRSNKILRTKAGDGCVEA